MIRFLSILTACALLIACDNQSISSNEQKNSPPQVTIDSPLSEIQNSAIKGDGAAQALMGVIYQNGLQGVRRDDFAAFEWFRKSADSGDSNGQSNLGHVYCAGKGVRKDEVLGAKFLLMAAEKGNMYAQFNIGKCFRDGEGVVKNDVEAYKWLLISGSQGNTSAKWVIEDLEPKLSQSQREEGQKRAKEFVAKDSRKRSGK